MARDDFEGIAYRPDVQGGAACITGTRIPVWVLIQYRQMGESDGDLLADYPTLTRADLANARDYYQAHRKEINEAIAENA
jgi:uncharacterized protein (DUF433 family)